MLRFMLYGMVALFVVDLPAARSQDGFVSLFAGNNLNGWVEEFHARIRETRPDVRAFHVENGVLICDGSVGNVGFIRYRKELCDFELRAEFLFAKKCNSGIAFRAPAYDGRTTAAHIGYEFQIQDDFGRNPGIDTSGALYSLLAPRLNAIRPAGEWNRVRIVCAGPRILIELNGRVVQDLDQTRMQEAASRPRCGYLSFQSHGGDIRFRNVLLKELQ